MPENCSIRIIKRKIGKKFKVDQEGLFVVDVWKSNIHREWRNHHHVGEINRKNDDIFVYYSACNAQYDDRKVLPRIETYVIKFEKTVQRVQYDNNQPLAEDVLMGYPILITFDVNISVTIKEIGDRILQLIKPFIPNIDINDYMNNYNNNNDNDNNAEKPFIMEARYWTNGVSRVTELTNSDDIFNVSQKYMQFVVHFNDSEQYQNDGYKYCNRTRDFSVPAEIYLSPGGVVVERFEYISTPSADLEECIDVVTSSRQNRLSQHNLWYCTKCKHFQCIKKKLQSWNSPDLLIIRLDRFNNGIGQKKLNYINMLMKFKIDQGLLLTNKNVLYDLYAIKNYDKMSDVACTLEV